MQGPKAGGKTEVNIQVRAAKKELRHVYQPPPKKFLWQTTTGGSDRPYLAPEMKSTSEKLKGELIGLGHYQEGVGPNQT